MVFFFIVVAAIVFFSLINRINALESRVERLEKKLDAQASTAPLTSSTSPVGPKVSQPLGEPTIEESAPVPAPTISVFTPAMARMAAAQRDDLEKAEAETLVLPVEPSAFQQATASIMALVKKNPFATAGVLMMLIGAGFLFSLLAANNILPPIVRVLAVAATGMVVFIVGLRQQAARTVLGLNLQGGALALEYLCVLWAYQGYNLIGTSAAFVCLAALSTLAFAWSVRTERLLFAFIGLAGALLTPIIASSGEGTFSALTLYTTWVSLLSVAVGLRLRAPSLLSAALAGASALLGAALDLPRGQTSYTAASALVMALAYNATTIFWTGGLERLAGMQKASVVSVLAGASLIMAGFLNVKAGISSEWCAALIGITAIAQIASMRRSTQEWRGWLLAIGGGLSLVAIGVGLEGASRAIALAASALGLILIAHSFDKRQADAGAALYWAISVLAGFHAWDIGAAGTTPLIVSVLVALGASYVNRRRSIGLFYSAAAPLVLQVALLKHQFDDPTRALAWFVAWALISTLAGWKLRWPALRRSAFWLLPAGLFLFVSHFHDTSLSGWNTREALLIAWLAGSATLMRLFNRDADASFRFDQAALSIATLLVPILADIELMRAFKFMDYSLHVILASSILLWSVWSVVARVVTYITKFDWQTSSACAVAAVLLAIGVVTAPSSALTESSQWSGIALLVLMARYGTDERRLPDQVLWGLAGSVLLGTLMRMIGRVNGFDEGALPLLFERVMQPWVSVLWAVGGVTVVMSASKRHLRSVWVGGGIALALLVLKMLLVDLAALSLVAKVTVFLLVGLGFIGLGYFCPLPPDGEEDADALAQT
ncbi:MAG TPA: DUF2339 domain-containing protein [Burkholderiaceae bacterium]|nr:DUF2339 domain-containing protein [Burkholderiaceae bacterium]